MVDAKQTLKTTGNDNAKKDDAGGDESVVQDGDNDRGVAHIRVDYISFADHKPSKPKVDRRIFHPLYITTAGLLVLPILPPLLVILLVTVWAILFVATPVYYFYYYDPLDDACGNTDDVCCRSEHPDAVGGAFA
ncbi:expressed unknown protein [Seminavis robusta]|uniref:Uncharacterized protein n=1 Tax=Seminavis robusta TaxID=568900 RepID=A0A9N8DSF4_9STRA|nr:expressed unknown protein [Seminavis robusta]|eukprot:Sro337_g120640.1 n/a (134) ;mRNA; f:41723-42124